MECKWILFAALLMSNPDVRAQDTRFVFSGIIEYEKKVNVHALIKRTFASSESIEAYIKKNAQFRMMNGTLTFSADRMRFDPENTGEEKTDTYVVPEAAQINIRYTDLENKIFTSEKTVFGDVFLVSDSVRSIQWKLTSEMRTIAGYECRRANALIMDSVYAVAYYTVQIPVPGGPESFSGLPGMILGVALPGEHITWFATKVIDRRISAAEIKPPVKGKPANESLVAEMVKKALGYDKDHQLQRILKCVLL